MCRPTSASSVQPKQFIFWSSLSMLLGRLELGLNGYPVGCFQLCEKYPISTLCAPPTGFRFMVKERLNKYRFKTLRHCTAGGEPLVPADHHASKMLFMCCSMQ